MGQVACSLAGGTRAMSRGRKKMQKPGLRPNRGAPRERKKREVGLPCGFCRAAKEGSRKALQGLLLHVRREGNSRPRQLGAGPHGLFGCWASWPGLAAGPGSYTGPVGLRFGPHSGTNWARILKPKAWALSPIDKNTIDKNTIKREIKGRR